MLSLFPSLLALEGFAPLLLRLTLGAVFIAWAYRDFKASPSTRDKVWIVVYDIIAISLIIGLYTQLSALASAIILGSRLFKKIREKAFLTDGVNYYLILFIISLSLLLTGPGFIAFDLPL